MGIIKDATKEGFRGATEGMGKRVAEAGLNAATEIAGESAKAIKTRIFGLGKGDEAKFSLALGTLEKNKRKIIINFMKTLTPGERNGLRQTIAEMDTKNGGVILRQYAELPNHNERRKRGEASGLIKASPWEKINFEKMNESLAKVRDFLGEKMKADLERNRKKEGRDE
jgi:hypothetical protein